MENHNGILFAESFSGKGSVFHARLPVDHKTD
jgi:signal transduction histidine kinase